MRKKNSKIRNMADMMDVYKAEWRSVSSRQSNACSTLLAVRCVDNSKSCLAWTNLSFHRSGDENGSDFLRALSRWTTMVTVQNHRVNIQLARHNLIEKRKKTRESKGTKPSHFSLDRVGWFISMLCELQLLPLLFILLLEQCSTPFHAIPPILCPPGSSKEISQD